MRKCRIGNNTEKKPYLIALKKAFTELNLTEVQINLLIDYFVNELSIVKLSEIYHNTPDNIEQEIRTLQNRIISLPVINEERENYHLKGNR